jgi:hypothetical protein
MSRSTVTRPVTCPMHEGSCGTPVVADFGTFATTTVEVEACPSLLAQGWTGPQLVLRKSDADARLGIEAPTALRHVDGLVTFA